MFSKLDDKKAVNEVIHCKTTQLITISFSEITVAYIVQVIKISRLRKHQLRVTQLNHVSALTGDVIHIH